MREVWIPDVKANKISQGHVVGSGSIEFERVRSDRRVGVALRFRRIAAGMGEYRTQLSCLCFNPELK